MRLLFDLWADALEFLPEASLLAAELACRQAHRVVVARNLWKTHFVRRCQADGWRLPEVCPPGGWKRHYFTVGKQLLVMREAWGPLHARFTWRCLAPSAHLMRMLDVHYSPRFSWGRPSLSDPNAPTYSWRIVLQRLRSPAGTGESVGIFLEQLSPGEAHCSFSIAARLRDGATPTLHAGTNTFWEGKTSGWLFPAASVLAGFETIVEVDLLVYAADTSCVPGLFQLLGWAAIPAWLRLEVVKGLGTLSHGHLRGADTRRCLQAHGDGLRQLLQIMADRRADPVLRIAAAGSIQNILDTSHLAVSAAVGNEVVDCVCSSATALLDEDAAPGGPDPDVCPREAAALVLNALLEVLWNLVIAADFRIRLLANTLFFPLLARILPSPQYAQTHLTCFHLLATLSHHAAEVPAASLQQFRHHFRLRLAKTAAPPPDGHPPPDLTGVSLRDLVDFCLPLLSSRKAECLAFGAWYFQLYYFHCSAPTLPDH